MKLWNSLIIAFAMYSKIPMPRADWEKENMRYTMCFFPLIGLFIGAVIFVWGTLGQLMGFGENFHTMVYLLIPILITGGIHMDGFLDTSDAWNSYQSMEKKLEILKDSHAGAFAIICCGCYFLLQFGVWAEVKVSQLAVLGLGFALSRCLSGLAVTTFPCAKNSGLAAMFADAADKKKNRIFLVAEALAVSALMISKSPVYGTMAVAAALVTYGYYYKMAMQKFGGITGDLAGWFLQVVELVMAVVVVIGDKIWF